MKFPEAYKPDCGAAREGDHAERESSPDHTLSLLTTDIWVPRDRKDIHGRLLVTSIPG